MKRVSTVTITTDASYCPRTNSSGFAFCLTSDLFRIKCYGNFTKKPSSPLEAEIFAIGNALGCLLKIEGEFQSSNLVVNTDCLPAITYINTKRTAEAATVLKAYRECIKKLDVRKHSFRHVRAHTGSGAARSKANEWCDKFAKQQMKNERLNLPDQGIYYV